MNNSSREQFEKLFPVPDDVQWIEDGYYSASLTEEAVWAANHHDSMWIGFNSRQPEIDELTEKAFKADLCLQAVEAAREALADHFGGNLAFLDDDLLRGVVLMKEQIDDLKGQITELVEALRTFVNYNAEAEGDVALTDNDELWQRAEALIAKHKGEA